MNTQNNCLTNPMEKKTKNEKRKESLSVYIQHLFSSRHRNQVVVFTSVVNQRKPNQKEREIP